ncbi:related to Oxidoreductase, short-chain dehydrogenase [Serendipita indica DSM 11827]|uniref:Related to Oxidoreductase, short-chain dehydrogenase n=1 Tax=Serendipita indica (strain DSM 11827) TaxID=1109443 RepID=G4TT11_SERID|nr:related to Oxidoreductase, short-chain dehydrogenase [Serendipita indica DSM 11827]
MPQWSLEDMVSMDGKIAIVTGGNGGIGYHATKNLLKHGAKVYMASRDSPKSHDAIQRLKEETGKDAIYLLPIDLSDLRGVRKAAEEYLSKESTLDVLMNNAGVMAAPVDQLTKDGYDLQFGVNVLAHFHLTMLLLPALLATPNPRVINISSRGHLMAPRAGFLWDKLKGPKKGSWIPGLGFIERYQFYGQSKLGNILFSNELARRYGDKGLIAISVHPGVIQTELGRNHNNINRWIYWNIAYPVEYGALTQLYAANTPEAKELSGKYLEPVAKVTAPSSLATDPELAKKLWEYCEQELKDY